MKTSHNKIQRMIAVILTSVLTVFSVCDGVFAAESSSLSGEVEEAGEVLEPAGSTDYLERYASILRDRLDSLSTVYKERLDHSSPYYEKEFAPQFQLIFIDDDDIPELMYVEDPSHAAGVWLYTYRDGNIITLGDGRDGSSGSFGSNGGCYYVPRKNIFLSYYEGMGGGLLQFFKIADNGSDQFIKEFDVDWNPVYTENKPARYWISDEPYVHPDEQVSGSEFTLQLKSIINGNDFILTGMRTGVELSTENIEKMVNDEGSAYGTKGDVFDFTNYYASETDINDRHTVDVRINGKGSAHAVFLLTSDNGDILKNQNVMYMFDDGSSFTAKSDDDGYIDLVWHTDSSTEVLDPLGESIKKQVVATLYLDDGSGKQLQKLSYSITLNIEIAPLSYKETWEGGSSVELEGSIGPKTGIEVGPAKATAALAKASASDKMGVLFNAQNEYDAGTRNLTVKEEFTNKVSVKGSLGPTAEARAVGKGVDVSPLTGKAGISNGTTLTLGTKLNDYNPKDRDDRLAMGRFLVGALAMTSGNVWLLGIATAMGFDAYNYYGLSDTIGLDAGASLLHAEIEGIGEGSVASAGASTAYKVFSEDDRAGNVFNYGCKKTSEIEGKVGDIGINLGGKTDEETKMGVEVFSGKLLDNEYSIKGKINKDTKDGNVSISGLLGYYDIGVFNEDSAARSECTFTYSGEDLSKVSKDISEIGYFTSGNPRFILDSSMEEMYESLDKTSAKADYKKTYSEETTTEIPVSLGASLGIGLNVGAVYKGVSSVEYDYESGEYQGGREYVESRSVLTEEVEKYRTDFGTILAEPISAIGEEILHFVTVVAGNITKIIVNGYAKVKSAVENLTGEFANRFVSISAISENTVGTAFLLTVYGESDSDSEASLAAAGDTISGDMIVTGEAVTVGNPYIVCVSNDEEGRDVIEDFGDSPLVLTLGYTDDFLSEAGLSDTQADKLEIYKYSDDLKGYVSVGGTLDRNAKEVSATINESGQYVLAAYIGDKKGYTIEASAEDGGKISPSGSVVVEEGSDMTFTITPDDNHRIYKVEVDGVDVGEVSTYTFENVSGGHTIKAVFLGKDYSVETVDVGKDKYTIIYQNSISANGTKHYQKGRGKDSKKKSYDVGITVLRNGADVSGKEYKTVFKKNKKPGSGYFKISFKGKSNKAVKKALKKKRFRFTITAGKAAGKI